MRLRLKNAFYHFPKGSIQLWVLTPLLLVKQPLVVLFQGHYFIGTNNDILLIVDGATPEQVVEITLPNMVVNGFNARFSLK